MALVTKLELSDWFWRKEEKINKTEETRSSLQLQNKSLHIVEVIAYRGNLKDQPRSRLGKDENGCEMYTVIVKYVNL